MTKSCTGWAELSGKIPVIAGDVCEPRGPGAGGQVAEDGVSVSRTSGEGRFFKKMAESMFGLVWEPGRVLHSPG